MFIYPSKDAYSCEDIKRTMTVQELKEMLENYDDDEKIYFSFDGGYTFGGLTEGNFEEEE